MKLRVALFFPIVVVVSTLTVAPIQASSNPALNSQAIANAYGFVGAALTIYNQDNAGSTAVQGKTDIRAAEQAAAQDNPAVVATSTGYSVTLYGVTVKISHTGIITPKVPLRTLVVNPKWSAYDYRTDANNADLLSEQAVTFLHGAVAVFNSAHPHSLAVLGKTNLASSLAKLVVSSGLLSPNQNLTKFKITAGSSTATISSLGVITVNTPSFDRVVSSK